MSKQFEKDLEKRLRQGIYLNTNELPAHGIFKLGARWARQWWKSKAEVIRSVIVQAQAGLEWYRESNPEHVNSSDGEMDEKIERALEMLSDQKDLDPEIAQAVQDNFWDMLDDKPESELPPSGKLLKRIKSAFDAHDEAVQNMSNKELWYTFFEDPSDIEKQDFSFQELKRRFLSGPTKNEEVMSKLYRDIRIGKIAAAYQAVIDAIADRDMTGEIEDAFNKYVDLIESEEE